MRYLVAMIGAVACALPASLFLSTPIANWVVSLFSFDSPDTVGDLHAFAFMASNVVALAVGWTIGWAIGGRFEKETTVE